ncbi:MAG: DMT family transporter [Bacillota bacterium]|jgi:drug/metabolite transporter (DMT)-like permease
MSCFFSGAMYVALAAILWSTGGVFIKLIPLDPVLIACLRCAIAGLVLLPFIHFKELKVSWQLVLLVLCYGGLSLCFVTATKLTAAANAIALEFTAPLWIFLFDTIYSRKIVWKNALPLILIIIGLGVILSEPVIGSSFQGNLIGVVCGVFFAGITLLFRVVGKTNTIGVVGLCNLIAAFLIWFLVPAGSTTAGTDITGWLVLIYLGLFQTGGGYAVYAWGLRYISAQKASMIALLEPVFNPIWVGIFVHEIPTIYGIMGGLFILLGLVADTLINSVAVGRIRGKIISSEIIRYMFRLNVNMEKIKQ